MSAGGAARDLEELRPYLELAREIRAEVDRVATSGPHTGAALEAALRAVPQREQARAARAVFDRLGPEQQWAVLEQVFGDDEVRAFLAEVRAARQADAERRTGDLALARVARAARELDLDGLPPAVEVTVGLFRRAEVQGALDRGAASAACARQVVVRTTGEGGAVHVLADVFNPRHGYFVTADYDEAVWATEHLPSHAVVRLGSAGPDGLLTPVVIPGGRVDVEVAGTVQRGHLHLGFALIGGEDVFAATS